MKKRLIALLLVLYLISTVSANAVSANQSKTALMTNAEISINSGYQSFEAYNIDGNNYFKLRDLAYALSGTEKKFELIWDANSNAIKIISGQSYSPVGGEMTFSGYRKEVKAIPTSASVYLNDTPVFLTAYNIGGNNYFKLRDIGTILDFSVEWDDSSRTIRIDTAYGYIEENSGNSYLTKRNVDVYSTNQGYISNWARISSLQQFSYREEGLAYAYVEGDALHITTPSKDINIPVRYPILGDVIADENGFFYVVWGRDNETNSRSVKTVYITKYTQDGDLVKETGFVEESLPWGNSDSAKTQVPFRHGNCSTIIQDDILVCYHSKTRYDGHQSDQVIAVHTDTMSPYALPNNTYSGHSFNQSVIYSELADDFIFASHGDAYSRGFRVNTKEGGYGAENETIFHFYLQSNADYNMHVVNKTFAQLGGLVETSAGVVLVGASAKSISEQAENEKQNLFIQIFDPRKIGDIPAMFVGGEKRSGAMSFDINDNNNSPLIPVTDYGVVWLTDYTDRDVIAPQVVVADDKIVILWNESMDYACEAFYMMLSSDGHVIMPATSLGHIALNSYEKPIYHNGKVCWANADGYMIRVMSVDLSSNRTP